MSFLWIPATGPDEGALARMRTYVPRPAKPMGEAWFMSKERKLHQALFTVGVLRLPPSELREALWDITSGTYSFGHFKEWDDWLGYMLPDLIARSHEQYIADFLLEQTISAFITVYWTGIPEPYARFPQDVLLTLGHAIMGSEFWAPDPQDPANPLRRIPIFMLQTDRGEESLNSWGAGNTPSSLAAALWFCLKYLPEAELSGWAGGLFNIEHPQWRFALLVWYVGAQSLRHRSGLSPRDLEKATPSINWENSHFFKSAKSNVDSDLPADSSFNLSRDFLEIGRLRSVLDAMQAQISVDRLAAWEATFWMDPLLASEPALQSVVDRALATLAA